LLQANNLFSQCISIEFSVTWEAGYHILKKDSMVSIPKLNIAYHNNCDTNYYFLKVIDNREGVPDVGCAILYGTSISSLKKPDYHIIMNLNAKQYTNQNFNVTFWNTIYHCSSWFVYSDTIDITKPVSFPVVNCSIASFCKYIRLNNNPNYQYPRKHDFEPSDVLPENILGSVNDHFVFLKSGETHIDSFNLVPFQIVEGCYTFYTDQEDIKSYVLYQETIFDKNTKYVLDLDGNPTFKMINHKLELPAIVSEYHRYSGAFNTNKVTVCFGDR
jgi:hypothetical protein